MTDKPQDWDAFSAMLEPHMQGVRSLVAVRMRGTGYAEDVLQETVLSAWRHRADLKDEAGIRSWLFQIARNKCSDHYRRYGRETAADPEGIQAGMNHHGRAADSTLAVELREALDGLPPKLRDAVNLRYRMGYSVKETAVRLNIPEGTVKRRLHDGRNLLRAFLSETQITWKGRDTMDYLQHLPAFRPEIFLTPMAGRPFAVDCPEALWMYESMNIGDTIWFGLYDAPDWALTSASRTKTVGKAMIHGIEAVEVEFTDWDTVHIKPKKSLRKVYLADVDGEVKTLAATWETDGVTHIESYLNSDFEDNWDSGVKRRFANEGRFRSIGPNEFEATDSSLSIGAGYFTVCIGERQFDCLRVLDAQNGALLEGFLLRDGHVLMGRRYNERMWKIGEGQKYGLQPWDERFPGHPRIVIDGVSYVHWYDSISDKAFR